VILNIDAVHQKLTVEKSPMEREMDLRACACAILSALVLAQHAGLAEVAHELGVLHLAVRRLEEVGM
jgi:hypothetical protein